MIVDNCHEPSRNRNVDPGSAHPGGARLPAAAGCDRARRARPGQQDHRAGALPHLRNLPGPLREAMRRLEAHRLIERVPHVGARVVQLSMQELLELFDVREALESMAARLAAEHMTAEEIAGLRELLAMHESQADLRKGEAYFQREGDLDFHYRIVQGSHNRMLVNMLCDDLYYLVRLYRTQFSASGSRPQRA